VVRLVLPLVGVCLFFAISWITVRFLRPREPRKFFLLFAILLAAALVVVYTRVWPLARLDDAIGLVACVLAQFLVCLTIWNAFYSLLWGFSGSLMHDLHVTPALRDRDALIRSYEGDGPVDRIMARRLPNMVKGGWISFRPPVLELRAKGKVVALGTLAAFRFFSLGMGGGVK
jgi:hypothetical protein